MGYLTEKEKCILFSAIHREEKVCKENGFDDLVDVCKRLTNVFSYNRFEKQIRNSAINKFQEKAMEEFTKFDLEHGYPTIGDIEIIVRDVADQMKRGNYETDIQ